MSELFWNTDPATPEAASRLRAIAADEMAKFQRATGTRPRVTYRGGDTSIPVIFGVPVYRATADVLPYIDRPSPGEEGRRIVRHGLARVLRWLGEDVGPYPHTEVHVLVTEEGIIMSARAYDVLVWDLKAILAS